MHKKVGTILDDNIVKKAKQLAIERHTTLNRLFEDALSEYISRRVAGTARISGVDVSFGALRLPKKLVRRIAQDDIYEA